MADESAEKKNPIGSDLVRDDPSFAEIVEQFVAGLSERLAVMETAIAESDLEALRVAAHQLKGSGGGYGYAILTERAAQLERRARSGALDECVQAIEDIKEVISRVVVDDRNVG